MEAIAVLQSFRRSGLKISLLEGNKLFASPRERITDAIRTLLREHKPALVELLRVAAANDSEPTAAVSPEPIDCSPSGGTLPPREQEPSRAELPTEREPEPLSESMGRPIPDEPRARIVDSTERFRAAHWHQLSGLGWIWDDIFCGMDATTARTYDEIHGLHATLADGGRFVGSDAKEIEFVLSNGHRWIWQKEKGWRVPDAETSR